MHQTNPPAELAKLKKEEEERIARRKKEEERLAKIRKEKEEEMKKENEEQMQFFTPKHAENISYNMKNL